MKSGARTRLAEDATGVSHGRAMEQVVASIVGQLEEDIVLGFIHLRERLVEDALIERFAAKRYAVREALAQLTRLGLVERLPNRGAIVRALTPAQVDEIYFVRDVLENAAAREVLRRVSPKQIEAIRKIQGRHDKATEGGDPRAAFRANINFHRAFFAICDNRELVETIELFAQKAHGVRSFIITQQEYLERARAEHWGIIEALEKGDEPRLLTICREHIQHAPRLYIASYRRRFPDPQRPSEPASKR